jgi:acetyltransferase-like isoleucine patch superfamily enzyme
MTAAVMGFLYYMVRRSCGIGYIRIVYSSYMNQDQGSEQKNTFFDGAGSRKWRHLWGIGLKVCREIGVYAEALVLALPGASGEILRARYLRFKLGGLGEDPSISAGMHLRGAAAIRIGHNFRCGRGCALYADGQGKILIGHRVALNSNVNLNAAINGAIEIGDDVLVGPGVLMRASDHAHSRTDVPIQHQGHVAGKILIEDDVWIGGNATILGGAVIHKGAIVAAGAVVRGEVPAYAVVGGVPARLLKWRDNLPRGTEQKMDRN